MLVHAVSSKSSKQRSEKRTNQNRNEVVSRIVRSPCTPGFGWITSPLPQLLMEQKDPGVECEHFSRLCMSD